MSKKEKKETKNTEVQEKVTEQPAVVDQENTEQEVTVSPEEARIIALEAEVEKLSKELVEEKETYLRKIADMDNYRKRLVREKEVAVQYANERLIQDLIPIIDDFDRAIEAGAQAADVKTYADGVKLIQKQLLEMLNRNWGLKRMEDILGKEFSPHEHEAMMMEEDEKFDTETILAELQKGYYLHDRVLRTAKVKVGKPL